MLRPLCWLPVLLLVAGCAAPSPLACPQQQDTRTAHVLFATDRKQVDPVGKQTAARSLDFGPARTSPPALQLGWQDVTLGPKHRSGILDSAVALAPAEIQAKPGQALPKQSLQQTDAQIADYVTSTVRAAIRSAPPPPAGSRRQVLLYIHGYNDTFNYAVRKTAQLAADLELVTCDGRSRGVAIAYSWPAQGTLLSYLADEENAEWTQQRTVPFLRALSAVARQEGADLHVIAHSMGARVLIRSLAAISSEKCAGSSGQVVDEVVLLAPDMARELFTQYIDRVLPVVGHLTIYVNTKDRALALSSILHGGHHRLGLIESTISTALNLTGLAEDDPRDAGVSEAASASGKIDMVDVTGDLTDLTGHSYEDPAFIHDLNELFYHHTPAGTESRSNLEPKQIRPSLFGLLGKRLRYFQLRKGG